MKPAHKPQRAFHTPEHPRRPEASLDSISVQRVVDKVALGVKVASLRHEGRVSRSVQRLGAISCRNSPPAPVTQILSFFSGQYGSKGYLASLLLV